MIKIDEYALICDLAETYQIYNYRELPPSQVAIFAIGLRDNSRIKMKISDLKASPEILLQAAIVDRLSILVWMQTKDGVKGINQPKSILSALYNNKKDSNISAFTSGKEFEKERKRLLEQAEGGSEWQQS